MTIQGTVYIDITTYKELPLPLAKLRQEIEQVIEEAVDGVLSRNSIQNDEIYSTCVDSLLVTEE